MSSQTGSEKESHGHFSEGQEKDTEHTDDKEHDGRFSEGQERATRKEK